MNKTKRHQENCHFGRDAECDCRVPKQLDAVADIVLAYRPTAKSKPAVQWKRRATILANAPLKPTVGDFAKLTRSIERKEKRKKKGGG